MRPQRDVEETWTRVTRRETPSDKATHYVVPTV